MTPTETLKHEHRVILLVLDAAEREVASIEKTGKVQADKLQKMLDFFRNFADRCHHAKEEKLLPGLSHQAGSWRMCSSSSSRGTVARAMAVSQTP